jgi:hypothetical protein
MPKSKQTERRYRIHRSAWNEFFFVEVDMEAEFEAWLDSHYEHNGYEGHDYTKNSLSQHVTFADPRVE